jgi:hypothetical protein
VLPRANAQSAAALVIARVPFSRLHFWSEMTVLGVQVVPAVSRRRMALNRFGGSRQTIEALTPRRVTPTTLPSLSPPRICRRASEIRLGFSSLLSEIKLISKHYAESKPPVPPLALASYVLKKVRCHENVSWDS